MFISLSLSLSKKILEFFVKLHLVFVDCIDVLYRPDDGFLFASFSVDSQSDDLIITTMVSSREEECYLYFLLKKIRGAYI